MHRAPIIAVTALVFTACAAQSPPPQEGPAANATNLYPFSVEQLAPRVHLLTQGNSFHLQPRGNVEVIEQRDGVVLVDSGGSPAAAEEVIAFVRSRTRKPVTAIVLTHWHGDHTLGVSRLVREWPSARVISTPGTRDVLASPAADRFMPGDDAKANEAYRANLTGGVEYLKQQSQKSDLPEAVRTGFARAAREYEQFGREMQTARRVVPQETFKELLTLADRDTPVEVHFLGRANTAGDAIVWLPKQRLAITGDVLVAPIPYGFNTYPSDWIRVLQKIRALNYAVLAPGHGSATSDTAYIDRVIEMLTDVRAQIAPFAVTKLDASQAAQQVNLDAARERFVGNDPWLQLWFDDYWKKPIVSSALREARGEEILQGAP